ncbi:MAG: NADP-dependent oxidoreductase [Lewinellaceae bacterium]|nr:NADP-dependent oxidoreductase [Lewinellaceae bacterium]
MLNHQWQLAARPKGHIQVSDFNWTTQELPSLEEGQVLIRNIYLSLDPANRGWIAEGGSYMAPVELGTVMPGICIGVVEDSRNEKFPQGTLVQAMIGWQEYMISDGRGLTAVPRIPGVPLEAFFTVLGHIGLTAYFGLLEIGQPKPGETICVSGAAGAVGSLVGQIGKLKGCRVVGIAGSDEKCQWLTETLGFDAAVNYKTENVRSALKAACPKGIDVIFENVGGAILDAELSLINQNARIALCGLISQYNAKELVPGPYMFGNILVKRARVEGFIVSDFIPRAMEAIPELAQWFLAGKLHYKVDIVEGLDQAPVAINKLFDGSNEGKLIVRISPEPAA